MTPARACLVAAALAAVFVAGCETVGPASLDVGECLERPTVVGDIPDLRSKSCAEPHGAEVFFVGELAAAGDYPAPEEIAAYITETCIPAYETYTGVDLMTQHDMDIGWLPPTEEEWATGNRRIVCYATPYEDGRQTTGSIRRQ